MLSNTTAIHMKKEWIEGEEELVTVGLVEQAEFSTRTKNRLLLLQKRFKLLHRLAHT